MCVFSLQITSPNAINKNEDCYKSILKNTISVDETGNSTDYLTFPMPDKDHRSNKANDATYGRRTVSEIKF